MNAIVLLLLCASVFRLTWLAMNDTITQPLRDRLEASVAKGHAELDRMRTPSRRSQFAGWLVEMLSCGWCTSWWIGWAVAVAWWAIVGTPDPVLWVPLVALTASAFTAAGFLVVGWLERLADPE